MNIMNVFNNLCETLDISSLVLFWVIVFIFLLIFLTFLTIALLCRNKELTKLIGTELEKEEKLAIKEEVLNKNKEEIKEVKTEQVKQQEPVKKNTDFVTQLSKSLSEASVPDTIDLTAYEQKQEKEAIISYKELMENKDRLFQITEDEEDLNFIKELKSFRDSLQ